MAHPFEKSGLGRAPFKFVGVESRVGPIRTQNSDGTTTEIGSPGQPMGTCEHCGMGIAICCTIQDADGKRFVVGSTCVNKTDDRILIKPTRTAINARAAEKRRLQAVARKAWLDANLERAKATLDRKPHPNGYSGKTLFDWAVWMKKNAGDQGRIRVEKVVREALGEAA